MKKFKIIGNTTILLFLQAAIVLERLLVLAFVALLVLKSVTYFGVVTVSEPSWLLVFSPLFVSLCLDSVVFLVMRRAARIQR